MRWFFNTTLVLVLIWAVLSGKLDALHFGVGVLGALFIAASFYSSRSGGSRSQSFPLLRFLCFAPWLMWQIFVSNLRIAWLVLNFGKKIEPSFVRACPEMTDPRALTLLGCSITLTPGTLTVDIDENEMLIHALDAASADDIRAGTMTRRVSDVFALSSK